MATGPVLRQWIHLNCALLSVLFVKAASVVQFVRVPVLFAQELIFAMLVGLVLVQYLSVNVRFLACMATSRAGDSCAT